MCVVPFVFMCVRAKARTEHTNTEIVDEKHLAVDECGSAVHNVTFKTNDADREKTCINGA